MKLVTVNKLPDRCRGEWKDNRYILKDFLRTNCKYAQISFEEYEFSSTFSAVVSLKRLAVREGLPIKAEIINGDVYLIRTDM